MSFKQFISHFFLLFFSVMLLAQQESKIEWEKFYPGYRKDAAHKIIEDFEGNLVVVGNTYNGASHKQDMLFWKLSPYNGKTILRNKIGTIEREGANAIVPTFDGGYIIAGFTETKFREKDTGTDPLLVKVDATGEPIFWYEIPGGDEDDAFHDVLQQADGSIVAVGHLGASVYLVKIAPDGTMIRKTTGGYNSKAYAVAQQSNGNLVVTGKWGQEDASRMFVLKFKFVKNDIDKIWERNPRSNVLQMNVGLDVIHLTDGGYALIGSGMDKKRKEQKLGLVIYSESGRRRKLEAFGGIHEEGGNSLVETADGNILLAGYSNSHQRGARRKNAWLQLVSQNTVSIWEGTGVYAGGKQDDELVDILETSDGQLFAAGRTASKALGDQDAWVVRLNEKRYAKQLPPTKVTISDIRFVDENKNDTLEARERTFIHFKIKNNGKVAAQNVRALVHISGQTGGVEVFPKVVLNKISAGDSIGASVPVFGKAFLQNGTARIHVSLRAENGLEGEKSFNRSINCKKEPSPQLKITESRFLTAHQDGKPHRRERIRLEIVLTNVGEQTAKSVDFRFIFPNKVEAIDTRKHIIGDLAPNESRQLSLDFVARSYFNLDSIQVRCVAREKSQHKLFNEAFTIKIAPFQKDLGPVSGLQKNPVFPLETEGGKKKGGPNFDIPYFEGPETITIDWIAPMPQEEQRRLNFFTFPDIDLKLKITSEEVLNADDFLLLIQRKENGRFDTLSTDHQKLILNQTSETGSFEHFYQDKIDLSIGINTIYLQVQKEKSPPLRINYLPPRGDLHVFSFGIPHEDLQFTAKDARDFANAFTKQGGILYENVRIIPYTSPDSTSKQKLEFAIQDIQNDYFFEDIQPEDVVMLFFASHGFTYRDSLFYLAASNYQDRYPQQTSLDFQREVLEILNEVDCEKIIFIDACKSGASSLASLAQAQAQYKMLLSCSPDEISFEDTLWQNGAFTEALLEIFHNVPAKMPARFKLDTDGDKNILTMQEIFNYIKIRVPTLIKAKRPRVKQTQTPFMPTFSNKSIYARKLSAAPLPPLDVLPLPDEAKELQAKKDNDNGGR